MNRLYGLDLLRALLIIEGVFFHAAAIVAPLQSTYSSTNYNSYLIGIIFQFFHIFRMETFFILSGFFSALVIANKNIEYFKDIKVERLLVPFLFLMIVICLPQGLYIHSITKSEYSYTFFLAHLWFLETLIFISIFHYVLYKKKIKINTYFIVLTVCLFFLSNPIAGVFGKLITSEVSASISNYLKFCFYYFFGVFFYNNKEKLILISKKYWMLLITLSVLSTFFYLFEIYNIQFSKDYEKYAIFLKNMSFFKRYIYLYLELPTLKLISSFSISLIIINIFISINLRGNKIISTIVDAALPIYIFHYPLVIILGNLFDNMGLNVYLYFILVSFSSLIFSFLIYFIFRKELYFRKYLGLKKIVN